MHMYLRWHLFYIVAIGFGHFRRLWFVSYLRIVCLATPPRLEDPPSPLYQSGTLFSNLALEPCLITRAYGVHARRITVQDPHPSHREAITGESNETFKTKVLGS